jgi:hypothetical protein
MGPNASGQSKTVKIFPKKPFVGAFTGIQSAPAVPKASSNDVKNIVISAIF